jgi:hypothetical protein
MGQSLSQLYFHLIFSTNEASPQTEEAV